MCFDGFSGQLDSALSSPRGGRSPSLWLYQQHPEPRKETASLIMSIMTLGLPRWLSDKESTCQGRKPQLPLGQEDHLEKEMATHSSILGWEIPWTEEPGGLQSMGLQRVRHDLATKQQEQIMTLSPGSRQVGTTRKTHSK